MKRNCVITNDAMQGLITHQHEKIRAIACSVDEKIIDHAVMCLQTPKETVCGFTVTLANGPSNTLRLKHIQMPTHT